MQKEAQAFTSLQKDNGLKCFCSAFIYYFNKTVDTNDRPAVLLIDSVSSHINTDIFTKADSRIIEIYKLVPNATNLMQLLEKGSFGPLKKRWYKQCFKTFVKIQASLLRKRILP